MTVPAEHLYDNCTCTGGMRNGLRCGDCNGRGLVPKGVKPKGAVVAAAPETADGAPAEDDGLDDMSIVHLRSRAKDLGLSAGGSKATLVAAIRGATRDADEPEAVDDAAPSA